MAKAKKKELTLEEKLEQALVPEEEWRYEVPGNWVWTRLGNVTKIIGGGTPSSSQPEFYENGHIPWICPADLSGYSDVYISKGKRNITTLGLQKSSTRLLPKGTVLLSSRAPIGYVAIALNELCTNQGFKNFLPSEIFISEYLYWYLKSCKEKLESYASGTTFLELSGSKAALVEFPIAPIAEQQRIVGRIESLFAKLDQAKELAQNALDTFETRKAAILHKAFTGELTAKWREKNGVGMESWEEKRLGECGKWFGGGTPSTINELFWKNGDILWVTPKDMKSIIITGTIDKITYEAISGSSANLIEKPAILFVMRSGILRRILPIAMSTQPVTINQDMKALIPDDGIDLTYLCWFCISRFHCKKSLNQAF